MRGKVSKAMVLGALMKWYGEDEKTAKARARGLAKGKAPKGGDA